jgi:Ca2+-binding EF-hand superfamily protein
VIERDEFVSLLEALDADLTDEQISAGLEALDRNRNGLIEFQEFIDWWAEK